MPRLEIIARECSHTRNTLITSSPRWLMTLAAIRPDCGLSNGREVSLLSVESFGTRGAVILLA